MNFKEILIGLSIVILVFLITMGSTFAYFTATAKKNQTNFSLAMIKIGFTEDTTMQIITSSTGSTSLNVLPGDKVSYKGSVKNIGNKPLFAILEFQVEIEGKDKPLTRVYYTADGNTRITKEADEYITPSTLIKEGEIESFTVAFRLNPNIYNNEYKNKKIRLKVVAHAIQYDNIIDPVLATNIMMKDAEIIDGGEVDIINYRVRQDIDYSESIEHINNPDQGFYYPIIVRVGENGKISSQDSVLNDNTINDNYQLFHLRFDISAFSGKINGNGDLSLTDLALAYIREELELFKSHEKNVIVRFCYHPNFDGAFDADEPAWAMLLSHVRQICAVLNDFETTITAVEAGMIGKWGEMTSASNYMSSTYYNALIGEFLNNTSNLSILVRTPSMLCDYVGVSKQEVIDNKQLTLNDKTKRLGIFNDSYMANWNDNGTYTSLGIPSGEANVLRYVYIEFLKQFTSINPYGGEAVMNVDSGSPLSSLENGDQGCLLEFADANLAYLNGLYDPLIIKRWKNDKSYINSLTTQAAVNRENAKNHIYTEKHGDQEAYYGQTTFTYIKNHMGYRYILKESIFEYTSDYNSLNVILSLDNVGFGNLTKSKKAKLIFVDSKNQVKYQANVGEFNGSLTSEFSTNINLANGTYTVYLCLYGDGSLTNPTYTIQFANNSLYNSTLKANKVGEITINRNTGSGTATTTFLAEET